MFTYSHANTPLGQSERAYYLSCFIKCNMYGSQFPHNALAFSTAIKQEGVAHFRASVEINREVSGTVEPVGAGGTQPPPP